MVKKDLWFRAKRYGYGWYPGSWQGWAVLGGYLLIVFGLFQLLGTNYLTYFCSFVATAALLVICYKTGEKTKWRWGIKDEKQ